MPNTTTTLTAAGETYFADLRRVRALGGAKRPVPRDEEALKALKKRTLTNLYNARPQWLADAHDALDVAVAAAYGWSADIWDDDVLPGIARTQRAVGHERTGIGLVGCRAWIAQMNGAFRV